MAGPVGWKGVAAGVGLALVALSCYGPPKQPPQPQAERVPTVVGRIVDREPDGVTFRLEGGRTVVVATRGAPASPTAALLSDSDIWLPDFDRPGGLLIFGEDAAGTFYAATQPPANGCHLLHGQGYIQDGRIQLSSGLVLHLAPAFELLDDRSGGDPSWILSFDHICLDREGLVTSVRQMPLGA